MAVAGVQRFGKGNNAASTSISIGSGDGWVTPTAGNLLVVSANGDFTSTAPTGAGTWNAGPSIVDGNGTFTWWKIATGTESTVTVSLTSGTFNFCITLAEYSGVAATPLDTSNSITNAGSGSFTLVMPSVTTTVAADLVLFFGLVHGAGSIAPVFSSWTASVVNTITAASNSTPANAVAYSFVGELAPAGAAGSYTSTLTVTASQPSDRQGIILAFKAGAAAPAQGPVKPMIYAQAVGLAANW
jgi:hypothetical protein